MTDRQLIYKLEDRLGFFASVGAALQWLVFMMLNTIFVPIVIGSVFKLSGIETAALIQRTIFLVGLGSLLQIGLGHRLPLVEGVAGLWWSVFILAAQSGAALGLAPHTLLPALSGGLILAGGLLILLSISPFFLQIERLFTPMVTGCYLILLSVQMSGSLLQGMLGVEQGTVDGRLFLTAFSTVFVIFLLSYKGKGLVKSLAPLGGILVGFVVHAILIKGISIPERSGLISIPIFFAWGIPRFEPGIILTSMITALILLTNLFASIEILKELQPEGISTLASKRGGIINGASDILAGLFSTIGTTPFSIAAGFIQITGNAARRPFLIASILMLVAGLFRPAGALFTAFPEVLAYSIGFTAFCQLMIFGIRSVAKTQDDKRNAMTVNLSLCVGIGIMFIPPSAFVTIPTFLRSILSNGMLVGTLLVLILEHGPRFFGRREQK